MNGIHDLGGMHGFGRIQRESDEPVFHTPWEGRIFGIASWMVGLGLTNMDAFRHAIERLPPALYLTASYYGRWLAAVELLLAASGVLRSGELDARARGEIRTTLPTALPATPSGTARRDISTPPRYRVGQTVRARNQHPSGHTRLPRYVRGKRGAIVRVHPGWIFPDTNAHGLGERPQYAYAVRFDARELWGPDAEPRTTMHVDLFEDYLEP